MSASNLELSIDETPKIEHLVVGEELHVARVGCCRYELCVQVVKPVRADSDAIARCGSGNFSPFRDTAAHEGVRLQDLRRALIEDFLEMPAPGPDLTRGNRDPREFRQARVVVDVIGEKRLLDPIRVVEFEALHIAHRRRQIVPGVVCVQHQLDFGSDRVARRFYARFLLLGRKPPHFHLHGTKTGFCVACHFLAELFRRLAGEVVAATCVRRHGLIHHSSEIFVKGKFRRARIQVPKGTVQDGDRTHDAAGASVQQCFLEHALPKAFDEQTFAAEQTRGEQLLHRVRNERSAERACVAESDALEASGAHFDKSVVARRNRARGEACYVIQRNSDGCYCNCFDLCHWARVLASSSE